MEVKVKKSIAPFLRQCFVTLSVAINIAGHGAVIGFPATLIPSLRRPESHIQVTTIQESYIASIVGIALIVGNVIMTALMGYQGRKVCHFLSQVPILIGWFMIVLADSVGALLTARFLQGVALGMVGPLGAVIIAEMTHPTNRGAFLSTISLSLSMGVTFCHIIGSYFSWQQTALVMSFIPFCSLILTVFAPESPSWLISKARYEEATEIFYYLRGQDVEEEEELDSMIVAQKDLKKSSNDDEKLPMIVKVAKNLRYLNETFRKPEFYKPITIMVFMFLITAFAGLNVINSYAQDIIRQVVGPEADVKTLMIAMDTSRLICNFIAVFLVRTLNRRTVFFVSGLSCVTCYFIKSVYVYAKLNDAVPSVISGQWFPIIILVLYTSLTLGLSIVPFTVAGEIYPLEYRALGGGISSIPLSLNFFLAIKFFPILNHVIGLPLTYVLYGGIVLICMVIMYFILPETKDKTLQEIEDQFRGVNQRDRSVSKPFAPKDPSEMIRRNSSFIVY